MNKKLSKAKAALWEEMDNNGFGYTRVEAIPDSISGHHDGFGGQLSDLDIVYIEKQGSWGVTEYECEYTGCGVAWYQDDQPLDIKRLPCGNICVMEWI